MKEWKRYLAAYYLAIHLNVPKMGIFIDIPILGTYGIGHESHNNKNNKCIQGLLP